MAIGGAGDGDGAGAGSGEGRSVLVTGGAGFIGTHTALRLLGKGYAVTALDNFHNSVPEALDRVRRIAGPALAARLHFIFGDLTIKDDLDKVFAARRYDAVVHFTGLKAVAESVAQPETYNRNNIVGTINLCDAMKEHGCNKLVFSSSATVYGQPEKVPCVEDSPLKALNPYGRTKLYLEEMLRDYQHANPERRTILLRYFNPIGAHESGDIGEDPKGVPNNLLPYIQQVAVGRLPVLNVYGHDYRTRDGTAVRDYIHVVDLADGHIAALEKLFATPDVGCVAYNLGTGRGTTVLEMVTVFEKAYENPGEDVPQEAGRFGGGLRVHRQGGEGARLESEVRDRGDVQGPVELGQEEPVWLLRQRREGGLI